MKKLPLFILTVVLFSCKSYDYVVDSDYSYSGKFNRYRTFSFVDNQSFAGEIADGEIIERSLTSTLQAWGYKYKEKRPDFYIIYSVYFEDMNLTGFAQPEFRLWLSQNFRRQPVLIKEDSLGQEDERKLIKGQVEENYDEKNLRLAEGTVLVSFIDRRKNESIWQGYASGVFGEDEEQNDRVIRSAVIQILDEYKILAFEKAS
ncbi:MAG: DUF4136 domain-containing protein [Ekhidna sp.]